MGAQLQTSIPISNGNKIVFVFQRLHGEIVHSAHNISVVKKHDGRTGRQKTQRFWPARRRVKSEPNTTRHGDRGPQHVLATRKRLGVWRIVSPLGALKIWKKPDSLNLKPP